MNFFAYLGLTATCLGMGTLVALALPTRGIRIGLGAVVFLALIVDGTWFLAPITGWSPALADAVWIGVVVLILGIAAVKVGLHRQPLRTWPSTRDLAFLAMVVAWFGALLLVLPVPLDTDAEGFGYQALTLREGHDYTTLAPFHPEIDYLYSPGFTGMIAHLSARFDLGIHILQLIVGALAASLFVWTAYDLGCEWEGTRTGRAFMLAALIGTGLVTVFLDSHFTALLALIFELAFITFVLRFLRTGRWACALLAAICLAGVPITHQDMTIALIIGYAPWLIVIWFARPRPSLKIWLGLAVIIPLAALAITAPWLISILDLLRSNIRSPYPIDINNWDTLIITQGVLCVGLVGIGIVVGIRQRQPVLLWMTVWIAGLVEFTMFGVLDRLMPSLIGPLLKYNYPFGLAWNGPLIPYTLLGGMGLVWLADRIGAARVDRWIGRLALPVLTLLLVMLAAGVAFFDPLLARSKTYKDLMGCFSSSADVEAMLWLRDHTPEDARILNHPGPHEGDWAPVVSERDTIYFRPQYFFTNTAQMATERSAFLAFWSDPTNPAHEELFREMDVSYVVVPQVFGNPRSFATMIRWMDPAPAARVYSAPPFAQIPYLRLVYDRDGAQVYEVRESSPSFLSNPTLKE